MDIHHSPNCIKPIPKFWGILDQTMVIIDQILNFLGTHGTQGNTMRGTYPPRQQEYNQFNDNSQYRDQQRGTQQHAWFDKRYNWRYLPPAYPPTPSLIVPFLRLLVDLYCRLLRTSQGLLM